MRIQFHAEIRGGQLKFPSAFVAAHWRNVRRPVSNTVEVPAPNTVEVIFPVEVSLSLDHISEGNLDRRLLFTPETLKTLHLQDGDTLIFECDDDSVDRMLLRVAACHSQFGMAMLDTRLDRSMNCFLQQIPKEDRDCIDSIIDVVGDGNCGYYCIVEETEGLKGVPTTVAQLRESLYNELRANSELYIAAMGIESDRDKRDFGDFINLVPVPGSWMDMSACFMISTILSIPILMFAHDGTCIYVPQRDSPKESKGPMICMAHVNGNHYVRVKLKPDLLNLPQICNVYQLPGNKNVEWEAHRLKGLSAMLGFDRAAEWYDFDVVNSEGAATDLGEWHDFDVVNSEGAATDLGDLKGNERSGLEKKDSDSGDLEGKKINGLEKKDSDSGHLEGKKINGLEKKQQIQQPPLPRERRRRNFAAEPKKRVFPKRKRKKPSSFMMEMYDLNYWKAKDKKSKGKKEIVEEKTQDKKSKGKKKIVEEKTVSSEGSDTLVRNVKQKDGTVDKPRGRRVKPRHDDMTIEEFSTRDDYVVCGVGSGTESSDTTKDKNTSKLANKLVKGKQQISAQDSGATTKSERLRIDDTIDPMIQILKKEFVSDEKEIDFNELPEELPQQLINMKGKKWRIPKAKWAILMLKSL